MAQEAVKPVPALHRVSDVVGAVRFSHAIPSPKITPAGVNLLAEGLLNHS